MDSANHNVLQFVSAAAQVFETQEGEDIEGSYKKALDDQHKEQQQKVIFYKPEQTRQLLAEAAGEEPIINTASTSKLKSSEIIQTVEEKLRSIFDLPNNEVLKGEWPCYLVQSAIVPGFMYLSTNHICFYASLPKGQVNKPLVI
ncbi:hypothetical protein BDF21DRAFT_340388 [Thamnidium elegans]|nr:hypothetical protein BDF21DRAFT_340388 [Thamnidium elegans]